MKLTCQWQEKMKFVASAGDHQVPMDSAAPIGSDSALTPKQLLLAAVCGCTAMDVAALMKKHRQPLESFAVTADAATTEGGYPVIFKEIRLLFSLSGALDPAKVIEAVTLSQTKYCGVSAMVAAAVPIHYDIELNGQAIGAGFAKFELGKS